MQRTGLAAAVILLAAGGFGLISTYQTTLVLTGLALAVLQLRFDLAPATGADRQWVPDPGGVITRRPFPARR